MSEVIAFFIITFAAAALAGLFFYRTRVWDYVDIIYYPLAAIGVILLFLNTSSQRQLLELNQVADRHRNELEFLSSTKPNVEHITPSQLTDTSFRIIGTISELANLCNEDLTPDTKCKVAVSLQPYVDSFLQVTRDSYESTEHRLLSSCDAAEQLLEDISMNGVISKFISDALIAQYKRAVLKDYTWMSIDAVSEETLKFRERASRELESIRNILREDDQGSAGILFDLYEQEIHFGGTILDGLYPCIVAPMEDLDLLAEWTESTQSEEEVLHQIDEDRRRIEESAPENSLLVWMQLSLWPFVLTAALSLKFGKGVATLRKGAPAGEGNRMRLPQAPSSGVRRRRWWLLQR